MGVFKLVGKMDDIHQAEEDVGFNTDSIFDLMTGDVVRGSDGKFYSRGGFSPTIAGNMGRPNQFKSTLLASLAMRACSIYQTEFTIFDSELAIIKSRDRILRMAGNHYGVLSPDDIICLNAKYEYHLDKILDTIKDIGEKKIAMGKDAKFHTPFLDKNGERVVTWRPTMVFIDSFTQCWSTVEKESVENKGIDDSVSNTLALKDANKKTMATRYICQYASQYGIMVLSTAHFGQKQNLDPYAANPKQLQWASANETPKRVGSLWTYLTNPLFLINSCSKLQDDQKQCKYKLGDTNPTDLSELIVSVQRSKGNASGITHPVVLSQDNGFLSEVTDYSYLRNVGKGFSMTGNNVTHQPFGMPDVNLTRNTFRGICQENPKVIRALQLGAQWLYIQNNWNSAGWQFPMKVDPKALVDRLTSDKDKYSMERVLNSRSYWLPDELTTKETPEYMSIFDILEFFSKSNIKV